MHGDDVTACMNAGMDGHLGKPLVIGQLLSLLGALWSGMERGQRNDPPPPG